MIDESTQSRSTEELGLSDKCPSCGGDADVPEILHRAANVPKAHITQGGKCSFCNELIEVKYRVNFCYLCGATFISPEEIAAGKLNRA
jgi:hypothetical protein